MAFSPCMVSLFDPWSVLLCLACVAFMNLVSAVNDSVDRCRLNNSDITRHCAAARDVPALLRSDEDAKSATLC